MHLEAGIPDVPFCRIRQVHCRCRRRGHRRVWSEVGVPLDPGVSGAGWGDPLAGGIGGLSEKHPGRLGPGVSPEVNAYWKNAAPLFGWRCIFIGGPRSFGSSRRCHLVLPGHILDYNLLEGGSRNGYRGGTFAQMPARAAAQAVRSEGLRQMDIFSCSRTYSVPKKARAPATGGPSYGKGRGTAHGIGI